MGSVGNHIDGGVLRRFLIGVDVVQRPALRVQSQGITGSHQLCQASAVAGIDGIVVGGQRIVLEYAAADLDSGSTDRDEHPAGIGTALNGQASVTTHPDRIGVLVVYDAGIVAGAVAQGQLRPIQGDYGIPVGGLTGEGVAVPVNGDLAAPECERAGVLHHLVLQEGQQCAGLTIGLDGGIAEGIEEGGRPIHCQRGRLLVAAIRAQAGFLAGVFMAAFLAAVGASGVCRQAVRVGTFDDLHLGGTVHVRQLHQAGAGLVGIALDQQSLIVLLLDADAVKAAAGQLCLALGRTQLQSGGGAAGHGQVALHIDTAVKGATFHLGMTVLNVEGVLLGGISVTASDEGDAFHGQPPDGIQLAHRHRRAGLGGAGILHGAVPDGHILCQYPQHRLAIGIAGQGVAAQIQGHGFVDLHGGGTLVEVAAQSDGVAGVGGVQSRFQAGVPVFANGVGFDQRMAEGAVAVRVHLANVVTAAAALALAVHIITCVRHHLDFALEIFRNGGIHNTPLIPEGIATVQKSQGLLTGGHIDSLLEGTALQVDNVFIAAEGNVCLEDRISLDSDLQIRVVGCLPASIAKSHAVQDQLAFCRGAADALVQRAVFQGEAAVGEVAHVQAFQGMAPQIQDHVLAPCLVVACVNVSGQHISRQVEDSAACQESAYLSRAAFGSIHDVVCALLGHQKGRRAARFPALPAVAVRVRPFMCAGVDRQGDGIGVHIVAADGQGAIDLGGMQPGLVGHRGQLATHEKILKGKFVPGAAIQLRAALQLPLIGNVLGQPLGPRGSHLDFLVALPGIQIPALAADGGILGLGGDGDGRTENVDGDGLGDRGSVRAGDSNGQAVSALLHGCIRCHRQSHAIGGEALRQAGVVSRPLGVQGVHIHILGGNGKGGLLGGNALIEVALLSLHREHGAGDIADVVSLLLSIIVDIAEISLVHFRHRCVLLVGSQNGQIAGIERTPEDCRVDAVCTAGGVDGAAARIQVGTGKTGAYAAVGLQAAALQIHGIKGYGVMRAASGLNGTTLKDQGSGTGCTARVGAVKDGTVALILFAPAVADDLQGTGTLDGQVEAIQIQGLIALDSVGASQRQSGVPGELDWLGEGLVVPGHLVGDGFLRRQGGHLAVHPVEQGFQLLHAGDLRLLGFTQGIKSRIRRFQSVQVAFRHVAHVGQGVDHGLHRRHVLVLGRLSEGLNRGLGGLCLGGSLSRRRRGFRRSLGRCLGRCRRGFRRSLGGSLRGMDVLRLLGKGRRREHSHHQGQCQKHAE